jgi:beta-lactamase class C
MLLHVALERRYRIPYVKLLELKLLQRLNLSSTTLPLRFNSVGRLAPSLQRRAVQGYSGSGNLIGVPGNMQGYFHWPGTGQMFSSARDMAVFLAAHMGELPSDPKLQEAAALTHRESATIEPQVAQAQAWEIHRQDRLIVDKNGGLNNTTTYIGMIPSHKLGVVILINRGELNGRYIGHPILLRLASDRDEGTTK